MAAAATTWPLVVLVELPGALRVALGEGEIDPLAAAGQLRPPRGRTCTLGRRVLALDEEKAALDELLADLVAATAPGLLGLHGVGIDTAATLLVTAGDNPQRLRSEAAWAHLCGVAPIQASSGKVTRYRLNRGGDRQANAALWGIVVTRMRSDPRTRTYAARRVEDGRSKPEIIRVLKRYVARDVFHHLPRG